MNSIIDIRNLLTRVSSVLVVVPTLAAGTRGQTVLVSDAHTSSTSENGNVGTNPILAVSANNTAYVRFEIAGTLPPGARGEDVAKATVKFYVSKVVTAGKLDLSLILGYWDEKTIMASNAPEIGPPALTTLQIERDAQGNYLLIDITDLVKQWVGDGTGQDAVPNYGFALAPHPIDADTPELAYVNFDSKENSQTSHDSLLSVQLEGGSTGLQSLATDATLAGDGATTNPLDVAPGAITSVYLAVGAVTAQKIVVDAVTSGEIADNAVGATKLADNTAGSAKLVDGSITSAKIAVPLSIIGVNPDFALSVVNTGTGPALTALGAFNTSSDFKPFFRSGANDLNRHRHRRTRRGVAEHQLMICTNKTLKTNGGT